MQPFTQQVVRIIRSIPAGHVMSYGQVAEAAGSRRAARQVVRILHAMSASQGLPWHRIVNARGCIAFSDEESRFTQRALLEAEGIPVDAHGCVDLDRYRADVR